MSDEKDKDLTIHENIGLTEGELDPILRQALVVPEAERTILRTTTT